MTRQEAIAEAKRRQASDPDASWIATSGDGEWTVVRIVKPELSHLRPAKSRSARSRGAVSARARAYGEGPRSVGCKRTTGDEL